MRRHHLLAAAALVAVGTALPLARRAPMGRAQTRPTCRNHATALKTVEMVAWTATQVQQMKTQIDNQLQTLKGARSNVGELREEPHRPGEDDVREDPRRHDHPRVHASGRSIRDFDGLFPRNKDKWKNVRYSDYDNYYTRWNAEITASSKAAARAQSSIATVEKNNAQIIDILSRSQSATGEVQAAAAHQPAAGPHLSAPRFLVQNLTSANRVVSNMSAASAGEKMLQRQAAQRRRDGYTTLGPPARRLTKLP